MQPRHSPLPNPSTAGSSQTPFGRAKLAAAFRYTAAFRFTAAVVSLVVSLQLVATTSAAGPSGAEKETARSLMDQADALVAQSDLEGALKRYQAAHQIMGVPTTGIEVARTQAKLGRLVEARAMAIEVANIPVVEKEPTVFADARKSAADLAQTLGARIPSVVVQGNPSDATVQIDGVTLPAATLGLPYKVNPGRHVLAVSAPGYEPAQSEFSVAEGEQQNVPFSLAAAAVVPAPTPDARPAGPGSVASPVADTGQIAVDEADLSRESAQTRGFIAFGVAGAAALVGAGAGVYSWMQVSDAQDKYCEGNRCSAAAQPLIDKASTAAWVANIGIGVAIVAAGYGLYELVANTGSPSEAARTEAEPGELQVVVAPQTDGAGLLLTGAF